MIEKVILNLARIVLSKRKYDTIASSITNELGWHFPGEMYVFITLCMVTEDS